MGLFKVLWSLNDFSLNSAKGELGAWNEIVTLFEILCFILI